MTRGGLLLGVLATAGCAGWQPLAGRYGLRPSETTRICLVHAQAFAEAGTLDDVAAGKIHWIDEAPAILEFLGAMEGAELAPEDGLRDEASGAGGHRALAVLFVPEDPLDRRQIELDEHLDILPGYVQRGSVIARPAFHTAPRFKRAVLDALGPCRTCRDYLGVHAGEAAP